MLESDQSLIRLIDSWIEKGPCKIRKRKEGFFFGCLPGQVHFYPLAGCLPGLCSNPRGFAVILDIGFGPTLL